MSRLPTGFHNHPRSRGVVAVALLLLLCHVPPTTQAASFDCKKARSTVEKLICSDAALSRLDDDLARAYRGSLKDAPGKETLRSQQMEWLTKTRDACKDRECLVKAYYDRIVQLDQATWARGRPAPRTRAGRYELATYIPTGIRTDKSPVYPENMELCKAYEANLNSFPEIKEPFACERPINPKFKDFSRPKWKLLDPSKHVELLVEIERVKYRRYTRPYPFDEAGYRKGIQEHIRQGRIRLKLAELDVVPSPTLVNSGPDGIPEKVLRVEVGDPKCDAPEEKTRSFPPVREYFIVNDGLTKVEEFAPLDRRMELFLYKGKVYFDAFYVTRAVDADSPEFDAPGKRQPVLSRDRYEIYLSRSRSNQVVPICRYRFID